MLREQEVMSECTGPGLRPPRWGVLTLLSISIQLHSPHFFTSFLPFLGITVHCFNLSLENIFPFYIS